jgi:Holliday junction DNA helicase RuvA
MIVFLEGVLAESLPTQVVINVHGVGYHVFIPLSSFDALPEVGRSVRLLTHQVFREDAQQLFGFSTGRERDLFRLLLNHVTGVGPKIALAVLSGLPVEMFQAAVVTGDIAAISKISGVGRKTAERMVLELKDKVGVAAEWEAASARNAPDAGAVAATDAVLALISLGYRQTEAHKAIQLATKGVEGPLGTDEIVRLALKILA